MVLKELRDGLNRTKPWVIDLGMIDGKRRRLFFATQAEAAENMRRIKAEQRAFGRQWNEFPGDDRARIVEVLVEIETAGFTLQQVWDGFRKSSVAASSVPLVDAIDEVMKIKRMAGLNPRYVSELEDYLRFFARDREREPIAHITSADLANWFSLRGEAPATIASNLGRLSVLWEHARRRGYVPSNICRDYDKPKIKARPPVIFPNELCRRLLGNCRQHEPTLLPYIVLGLFAGVRPDEIKRLTWADVNLDRKNVTIAAAASKLGQRRITALVETAIAWLKLTVPGKPTELVVPLGVRKRRRRLAKLTGIDDWPQDVLRHTAATHLLHFYKSADATALQLGNSARILFRNYRELVPAEESENFFGILPEEYL